MNVYRNTEIDASNIFNIFSTRWEGDQLHVPDTSFPETDTLVLIQVEELNVGCPA
jgi:hypothetical protein